MAKNCFRYRCSGCFSIFVTIYYIIRSHLFEYNFAWEHSSKALDFKYLLACIWEAQEGSFLLWTMWHSVLGIILIFKAGKWEAPVMTVISFAQFCLATMIMGFYFFGLRLGNSPFLLVRQMEALINQPFFNGPIILPFPKCRTVRDSMPCLQNYWMVIHPPVLFLGFASTIVPFAYAFRTMEKTIWTMDEISPALDAFFLLCTGNRHHDGSCLGL